MNHNDPNGKKTADRPAPGKRSYATPRLIEYGSVAKLTQGTRTNQQDSPGASTFKRAACL